ncbi:MAG: helix-turn-helix domain-containing protein [Treponema sp.]|jgi:transcriptional regulator with XRE-family HTH domain|nr:helix-turn-helix domain-containing protein [Treponema sp.]
MGTEKHITEEDVRYLVGMNVRRLRQLQKLSQLDLAINADLTHNFINDLESGKKGISCRSLAKLSTALQVEPFQFFLPKNISGGDIGMYVRDFNDKLQKIVGELTRQYTPAPSNGGAGTENRGFPIKGKKPENQ